MRDRLGPVTPLLALGGVGIVVALAAFVSAGVTDPVDAAIIGAVRSPDLTGLLAPLRQITELGSTLSVTIVAVVTVALAVAIGPWRHGVAGALTIVGASLLNASIKLAIARERPDLLEPLVQEHGFSFPSGHSALGMVAYGILAVVIWRSRLRRPVRVAAVGALIALVLLIGVSRVWLGVHYPTDVVAGWTAGAIIVLIYRSVTRTVSTEPAEAAIDAPEAATGRPYDAADG
jgi:undecaprenyl-diphosphatase